MLNNPGVYSLTQNDGAADLAIASDGTFLGDVIDGLDGMVAVTLFARLAYGSGGSSCKVYVQVSCDFGASWIDIAAFAFGTASEVAVVNLSGLTPKTSQYAPTDGTLADDSCVDGILGDRLRCKVVAVGSYAGSTMLTVRAAVR